MITEATDTPLTVTRYQRIGQAGALYLNVENEKRCERRTGHMLMITADGIKCYSCGARWEDMHNPARP